APFLPVDCASTTCNPRRADLIMCREARESTRQSREAQAQQTGKPSLNLAAGRNQFCGIGVTGSTPSNVSEVLVRLQDPAPFPAPGPVAQLAVAAVKGQSVGSSPTSAKDRNHFPFTPPT